MEHLLNKIHLGDCMDIMRELPDKSIDLVLTDPPYGMSFQSSHRKEKYNKIHNDDNLNWLGEWVSELKRVVKEDAFMFIFCSFHFVDVFKENLEFDKLLTDSEKTYQILLFSKAIGLNSTRGLSLIWQSTTP